MEYSVLVDFAQLIVLFLQRLRGLMMAVLVSQMSNFALLSCC